MARKEFERLAPFVMAIGLAASGIAAAAPAGVGPTRTAWSTYLRAGAGETSAVIDELEHDTPIEVLGCADHWCRVTSGGVQGYIDQDALALPAPPSGKSVGPGAQACFSAGQTGWRGPTATRFCQPFSPAAGRAP